MVSLTKVEKQKLKEILVKSESKEAKDILDKISKEKKIKYVEDKRGIITLLRKAYQEKKKVKIRYYSLTSDEVRWRKVDIYQFDEEFIITFCYLRNEERVFKTARISRAAMLDENYKIPKGWTPESKVWSN